MNVLLPNTVSFVFSGVLSIGRTIILPSFIIISQALSDQAKAMEVVEKDKEMSVFESAWPKKSNGRNLPKQITRAFSSYTVSDPGTEPRSPALQTDSLPAEPLNLYCLNCLTRGILLVLV